MKMNDVPVNPRWAWARIAAVSALTAGLMAVIGYGPSRTLAATAGVQGMLAGIGVALVGAWAGSAPTLAYLSKPVREHAIGILLGICVRFMVTIGLAIGVWLGGAFAERPLLVWVGLAHFVILLVDVWGLAALLKRAAPEANG
jgi:hypothetical protein